jgi:DNA-binding IclR family transcriptional regulator
MELANRELLDRIRMEYTEMPDLRLTVRQARRLWNLEPATCDDLLDVLVREGFLAQTSDGAFLRRNNDLSATTRLARVI